MARMAILLAPSRKPVVSSLVCMAIRAPTMATMPKAKASSGEDARRCQTPVYDDQDIDCTNKKEFRLASKDVLVKQNQPTDALREACKRAAREQREQEVGRARAEREPRLCQAPLAPPGSSNSRCEDQDFDAMSKKELLIATTGLHVNQKQPTDALRDACKRATREHRGHASRQLCIRPGQ